MLSVVICTHNEETNLPRAVQSVKKIAGEVIVVDTESTDQTISVAKKLGCKVFHHAYTGIVEPVRNFAIEKAKGDWILLLDADEEISPSLAKKVSQAISSSSADYYRIPRQNIIFSKWITGGHWWPDYVYRLFKKGFIHWQDTIHSLPITRGIGADFPPQEDQAIIHHNYQTISQFIIRMDKYTDHQSQELVRQGYSFQVSDLVSAPVSEFFSQYFSRRNYQLGTHGLALSLLQSFSQLACYLKVWQSQKYVEQPFSPGQLSDQLSSYRQQWRWWHYQSNIDNSPLYKRIFLKLMRRLSR